MRTHLAVGLLALAIAVPAFAGGPPTDLGHGRDTAGELRGVKDQVHGRAPDDAGKGKSTIASVPPGPPEDGGLGCNPCPVSDIRLKRDIALLDRLPNGLGVYRYRYLWSDTVYVGVMAQEVAASIPDAVVKGDDGFLRVNYTRLGLHLSTWDEWVNEQTTMHAGWP
jgi:Chaperone of endosialidase